MNLVAGTVQKAGVDKHDALAGRFDARLEVDRRAALFVHDADFERITRQREHVFDAAEQLVGEGGFFSAVHFRFNDINRTRAAVFTRGLAVQAVHRGQAGEQTVEDAFRDFVTVFVEDRVDGHQVTHVTHEQQ